MSFGYGVGDFLAVIKLANDIRKDFADAPEQFQQINAEIRNLAIVLGDVDVSLTVHEVSEDQENYLKEIRESCRRVLEDASQIRSKYSSLDLKDGNLRQRTKRVWKRLKWEPDDIRDLRDRIISNISALSSFTGASIRDTVLRLEEQQARQQARQQKQETLEWLTPLDISAQQADSIRQRQTGTGQWLLDSTEYIEWKATRGKILMCHGIPGVGKTVLSSIVVDNLQSTLGIEADVAICYFYFKFQNQDVQVLECVLLSFLKQLSYASASVPDDVRALYDECQSNNRRPNHEEIRKTLWSVAGSFSRVLIVVDALDECRSSNGCQSKIISHLIELQRTVGVNILVTSRPVPHIVQKFSAFASLEVIASTEDIDSYVERNIEYLPRFVSRDKKLQTEIKEEIAKAVDGMFLLAKLHLDSLKGKRSPKALRQTLKALATGNNAYVKAYQNTMCRIKGQLQDQEELAISTLMWIVYARRPLTTLELRHALGVENGDSEFFEESLPDLDDMVSACCGLATIDEETSIIRLIHYTAQEFFDREGVQYFPNAKDQITDACATYLAFDVFDSGPCLDVMDFKQRLADFPLYGYSSQYWGDLADPQTDSEAIRSLLTRASRAEACGHALMILLAQQASRGYLYMESGPSCMTGLHLAAHFGLVAMTRSILDDFVDPDIRDSYRCTPLWYAARKGHQDLVRLLLDRNCSPNAGATNDVTPLDAAARYGHEAVVRLLLESGAHINREHYDIDTPLGLATKYRHGDVVRLLLERGAHINHTNKNGQTPLSHAARGGCEVLVRLLLDRGAHVNHADDNGHTPLSSAARNGHEAVVRLLLQRGAQINCENDDVHTPLTLASTYRHEAIVRLLLEKGINVNHIDKNGNTPLSFAAKYSHEAVVRLLLNSGARIDYAANKDRTALLDAARRGHSDIVKLLLLHKANVNSADASGWTPLLEASWRGRLTVLEMLIEHNSDISAILPAYGSTALMLAAEQGHLEILKLLIAAGANHRVTDIYGRTAFVWTIIGDYPELFDILLAQSGLDPNTRDHWGTTAISFAARTGNLAVFKKIAALPDVDLFAQDSFGRTPFWWAQRQRHDSIAMEIIEHQRSSNYDTAEGSVSPELGEPVEIFGESRVCDVCCASSLDTWRCGICTEGDFDICRDCYRLGARCLVGSHELHFGEIQTSSD